MSLANAFRPRKQNSHKGDAEKRCEPFLKWIRGRPCWLVGRPGHICSGKVRACHVDYAGDKGMGTKVSDRFALPMCDGAHAEQTDRLGWHPFEEKYGFVALDVAGAFWKRWLTGTSMGRLWASRQDA